MKPPKKTRKILPSTKAHQLTMNVKQRGVLWWMTATGMALFGALLVVSFRVQYHSLQTLALTTTVSSSSSSSSSSLSIAQAKEHFQVSLLGLASNTPQNNNNSSSNLSQIIYTAPWRNSDILPSWIKDYFAWHQQSLADLKARPSHWSHYQYLVVRCVHNDQKCGGAADRLKSLPLALLLAAQQKRLLFYYWERPVPLTEFYQPPNDGLDWRWPPVNIPELANASFAGPPHIFVAEDIEPLLHGLLVDHERARPKNHNGTLPRIASMRYRSHHHGSLQYNQFITQQQQQQQQQQQLRNNTITNDKQVNDQDSIEPPPMFEVVFRHVWQSVFAPSPALHQRIQQFWKEHDLLIDDTTNDNPSVVPFSAIHVRSKYIDQYTPAQVQAMAKHAVDCLAQPQSTPSAQTTILVSADDPSASQMVMDYGREHYKWTRMISLSDQNTNGSSTTLHLDRGQNFLAPKAKQFDHTPHSAADYYDTFRDVALMAHTSECLVTTHGNYAKWAHLLRPNQKSACILDASTAACGRSSVVSSNEVGADPDTEHNNDSTNSDPLQKAQQVQIPGANRAGAGITRVAPWRTSEILPQWMKDYFAWHQEARHNMSTGINHWKDYDYLVYRCLEIDGVCGGAADRLRPLPFVILLAQKLKRLVFYKWERPTALEEFLVPPIDGLDWRWPPHPDLANHGFASKLTIDKFKAHHLMGINQKKDFEWTPKNDYTFRVGPKICTYRFQSTSCGAPEFNAMRMNKTLEPSYHDVFPDVWNSVFAPAPPVQALIDQHMNELQLQTDKYHAIHIRSQYHKELGNAFLRKLTQNAVNCLYQYMAVNRSQPIQADTPVFLASDNRDTLQRAMKYAKSRGLQRVVALNPDQADKVTLHLDRGAKFLARHPHNFTRHEPREYYDTFVDLYLLSQAQCITFNVGNYAKWANFFSSDPSCEYSHMKDKTCTFPVGGVMPGK